MRVRVGRRAELEEDLRDVRLDRALGDEEPRRDRAVGEALGDEREHLALAGGQLGERVRRGGGGREPRDDRRVDHGLAVGDPPQRVDEDRDVEDALLEQVADALGMLLEQPHRVARLDVLREHEHADARGARPGSPARRRAPRRCASAACGCRRSRRRAGRARTWRRSPSASSASPTTSTPGVARAGGRCPRA